VLAFSGSFFWIETLNEFISGCRVSRVMLESFEIIRWRVIGYGGDVIYICKAEWIEANGDYLGRGRGNEQEESLVAVGEA